MDGRKRGCRGVSDDRRNAPGARTRHRRGVSLVEVLVAVAILAFCAVPILTMLGGEQKKAEFNEAHQSAQTQARWSADALQSLDYAHLLAMAAGGGAAPADVPGLGAEGLRELPPARPPLGVLLAPSIAADPAAAPYLNHAAERETFFKKRSFFGEVAPGLGRLVVLVTWSLPGEKTAHHVVYERLIMRPETSMDCHATIEKS